MNKRIGLFFFLVGLLVMFVFFASYMSRDLKIQLFLISLGLIFLGMFMIIKNRKLPGESERFRRIRKIRSKKKN